MSEQLTQAMKTALDQFHGSAKTRSEARVDLRTVNALIERGLLRAVGNKRYNLTPRGVVVRNEID